MIKAPPVIDSMADALFSIPTYLIVLFAALLVVKPVLFLILKFRWIPTGVLGPKFTSEPLLNKEEIQLFNILLDIKPEGHHLFSQVSYGEFLNCGSNRNRKFWSINAKRADFVLCNAAFKVVSVIEYQGGGHFGWSKRSREDAEWRDDTKRTALSEAGIRLIEVLPKFNRETVERQINQRSRKEPQSDFVRIEPTFSGKPISDDGSKPVWHNR